MKQRGQKKAVLFVLFYVFVCIVPVNGIRVSSQDEQGRDRGKCTVYIDILYYIVGRVSGGVWGDGLHISGRPAGAFWVRDKKIYSDFSGF